MGLDEETWKRARGWALWKALIVLAEDPASVEARGTLARLRADTDRMPIAGAPLCSRGLVCVRSRCSVHVCRADESP